MAVDSVVSVEAASTSVLILVGSAVSPITVSIVVLIAVGSTVSPDPLSLAVPLSVASLDSMVLCPSKAVSVCGESVSAMYTENCSYIVYEIDAFWEN